MLKKFDYYGQYWWWCLLFGNIMHLLNCTMNYPLHWCTIQQHHYGCLRWCSWRWSMGIQWGHIRPWKFYLHCNLIEVLVQVVKQVGFVVLHKHCSHALFAYVVLLLNLRYFLTMLDCRLPSAVTLLLHNAAAGCASSDITLAKKISIASFWQAFSLCSILDLIWRGIFYEQSSFLMSVSQARTFNCGKPKLWLEIIHILIWTAILILLLFFSLSLVSLSSLDIFFSQTPGLFVLTDVGISWLQIVFWT